MQWFPWFQYRKFTHLADVDIICIIARSLLIDLGFFSANCCESGEGWSFGDDADKDVYDDNYEDDDEMDDSNMTVVKNTFVNMIRKVKKGCDGDDHYDM